MESRKTKKYSYLHIIPDNKFIGDFVRDLSLAGDIGSHQFLAFNRYDPGATSFKYLDFEGVTYAPPGTPEFASHVSSLGDYDKIFIHWLLPELEPFVRSIPAGPIVYWCFWGEFDASLGIFSRLLRYERGSRVYARAADMLWTLTTAQKGHLPWINGAARKVLSIIPRMSKLVRRLRAVSRVDVLLHWNKIDHSLLRKISFHPSLKYQEFFYNVIEKAAAKESRFVDALWRDHKMAGKRVVLVGHSAFASGNHLEALELLSKKADDHDIRVIAVMSYGDPIYREVVTEKGRFLFGERFIVITEFLPVQEYYYLTSLISAAILNHRFSEGAANIFRLMLDGKPIFLSSKSTVYQMLKSAGLTVFDLKNELSRDSLRPLSLAQATGNSEYIKRRFSKDKSLEDIKKIFEN